MRYGLQRPISKLAWYLRGKRTLSRPNLAVIGGTGLTTMPGLEIENEAQPPTRFGAPSAALQRGRLEGAPLTFLARHGAKHTIAPHCINYRANIWALKEAGCSDVLAVAAVGGIAAGLEPGCIVVPHQIVDYTYGREHTFYAEKDVDGAGGSAGVMHVDFTNPYCESLRQRVLQAAGPAGIAVVDGGVYGATQGPRLESAAEIDRLERDGCTLVGMTGMPEAALAREAELCYAHCAVVVNEAAGRGPGIITMEDIRANLQGGMDRLATLLRALARQY